MAATGEECLHQKPIRYYFDVSYDLNFDAEAQHYCRHFDEMVIPAQHCGTKCPAFKPLKGTSELIQLKVVDGTDDLANDARARTFLRKQLNSICSEIEQNAQYLERQLSERERKWREADEWLSRQDTSLEALGHAIAAIERRVSIALNDQQRIRQRLTAAKSRLNDVRDLERLWLEQEKNEREVKSAKHDLRVAQDRMIEREKREAEQDRLYGRWDDALERVPLLRQLRGAATRHFEVLLTNAQQPLSDTDVEHILQFLRGVSAYSADDVGLSTLRRVVEYLQTS